MFSIKWQNDVNRYKTTFYGFERFHNCNAAQVSRCNTSDEHNALKHLLTFEHSALVSYDTPICIVTYYHDHDTGRNGFNIDVNRNAYRCSNSTIHQFSRFLRENVGDILTYHDVKYYDELLPTAHDVPIRDVVPIHIFWMDRYDLRNRIEHTFEDCYWCTNVDNR